METLQELRHQIDTIDKQMIVLLSQRNAIVSHIGTYKKKHRLLPLDETRRSQVLVSLVAAGKKVGLNKQFVIDLRERIHVESLTIQQ